MCGCYLLKVRCFLVRDRKGVDPEGRGSGEELGGVKGGKIIIKIYCMWKETIFNKEENEIHYSLTVHGLSLLSVYTYFKRIGSFLVPNSCH